MIKRLITSLALACGLASATATVSIIKVTSTQAAMQVRGNSGDCTIKVSKSPTFSPVIPDVNGTIYASSSAILTRPDTIVQIDGTVLVTIGHQTDDRALATATTYYWQLSGGSCGGNVSGYLVTANIGNGSNLAYSPPFNASNKGNSGYPLVNLLAPDWLVDPSTGVELKPINSANDLTWRTGGGSNPLFADFTAFQNYSGGTSWSNPANVLNNSASTASTTNTNPIDLYGMYDRFHYSINADGAYDGISFDDLGIVLWGSATNQTSTNNQFTLCLFTNPTSGCIGTPIVITATSTSGAAPILSSSTDPNNPWPSSFPAAFFSGWGLTGPLGPEHVNTQGTLTGCTASVCTITTPTMGHFFPDTILAGQKIYIAGSSPTCAVNLCTVASFQNAGQLTLVENLTIGAVQFNCYMWGIRITKSTSTGTLVVGAAFKHAGTIGIGQPGASTFIFNPHGFTSGDGHFGYTVVTPGMSNITGHNSIYFVSADGTSRPLWHDIAWGSASCYASGNVNDRPGAALGGQFVGQASPDATDPKTWYIYGADGSGSSSLWKIVYSGDTTEALSLNYTYAQTGVGPMIASTCGNWFATNLTPSSSNLDVASQIANNWSGIFDTSIYPNLGSSWLFNSSPLGGYAIFKNAYSGGQNGASWIAFLDLSTGTIVRLIHTLDGTGTTSWYGGMRFSGNHSIDANLTVPVVNLAEVALTGNGAGAMLAGPYEFTPIAKLGTDGVTWNTNTSLPWPNDHSYYDTCPVGNTFEFLGATGTNCVTLKIPTGGACNTSATAFEKTKFPACPWNASYTAPVPLIAGDTFVDFSAGGFCGGLSTANFLCENIRIISVTAISGALQVVAQRNAMYDYCSFNPTNFPGSNINNGVITAAQLQHANGWLAAMGPGRTNGCYGDSYVFNAATNAIVGESGVLVGHSQIIPGTQAGLYSFIVGTTARVDKTLDNTINTGLFGYPSTGLGYPVSGFGIQQALVGPVFQGQTAGIGGLVQSYVNSPGGVSWELDAQALNPAGGQNPEYFLNTIANAPTAATATPNVYTITPVSNGLTLSKINYKIWPLIGWAGRYVLHDISGPSSNIISNPWGICYVYTSGECYSGSTANQVYVNIPGAWLSGQCLTGQSFLNNPCVLFGSPGAGSVRQQRIYSPDPIGQGTRTLSTLLAGPGIHYPYTHLVSSPDGTFALAAAHHTQGWTTMAWMLKLPPWQEDSSDRTKLGGIKIQIPAGQLYAEVQFALSRYIGPSAAPSLGYCTNRREACNTRSDTSTIPFNYDSDSRSNQTCTSGCTITIPVPAGNMVYYWVRRSTDGITWTNGPINIEAVP